MLTGQIVTATKRGRVIAVPVTPRLRALWNLAMPREGEEDVRMVDLLNDRRMVQGRHTIGERWQRWKKQVGLPPNLHIHDLRRDAAHRAYAACGDVREVQGMLGHQSPMTTLVYLFLANPKVANSTIDRSLIATEKESVCA